MNHDYIERFDLVDQYLMGRLSTEESTRFEEHFVDCPQCVDRLQVTRSFRRDLRLAAVQKASEADTPRKWWPSILSNIAIERPWALAAGCLVLLIAVSAIFVLQMRRLQANVDDAKSVVAQLEQHVEEQRQIASTAESKRQEVERSLTGQINELQARVQTPRADTGAESAGWMRPMINLKTFNLLSVRGGRDSSGTLNPITPPKSGYVISVPLEGELDYEGYRIVVSRGGKLFSTSPTSQPTKRGSLDSRFGSKFFPPGRYVFEVFGISKSGDKKLIGNYPVLIKRP